MYPNLKHLLKLDPQHQSSSLLAPSRVLSSINAVARILDNIDAADSRVLTRITRKHRAAIRSIDVEAHISLATSIGPHGADYDCLLAFTFSSGRRREKNLLGR